jgi:hypothetical protein
VKKLLFVLAVMVVIPVAVAAGSSGSDKATTTGRVGSPSAYAEIAASTNCADLQATFDGAESTSKRPGGPSTGAAFYQERYGDWADIGIAYMKAADARMQALGCYR